MMIYKKNDLFIWFSSKLGPNVLDWLRSIYFSLIGSSMLTLFLKFSALNNDSKVVYILGCLLLLIGLLKSVKIADRFKKHEKNYDAQSKEARNMTKVNDFYFDEEIDLIEFNKKENNPCHYKLEHFLLYTIWLPAFFCIGYAGFYMEDQSKVKSAQTNKKLNDIFVKIEELDSSVKSTIYSVKENELIQDSLLLAKKNIENRDIKIESLRKTINALKKQNNNSN